MEYGRLVVLGYSSYRVASSSSSKSNTNASGDASAGPARSPQGMIGRAATRKSEKDRRTIGQLWEPIGDQNAQYVLTQRASGNGVKLSRFHHFVDAARRAPEASATSHQGKPDLKTVTRRILHAIEIRNRAVQRSGSSRELSSEEEDTEEAVVSPSSSSSASSTSSTTKQLTPASLPSTSSSSFLMCVPMNDADAHASVTEYVEDGSTDMFQIGRMPCSQNDVVIPGPRVGASGTISRFAARILCAREAPHDCRIFAGGFDASHKMTTAGHALKRCSFCFEWLKRVPADHKCIAQLMEDADPDNQREEQDGENGDSKREAVGGVDLNHVELELADAARVPIDGLTKNGVRVWLPDRKQWFEVSVNGNLYAIAPRTPSMASMTGGCHAAPNPDTSVRHSAFNRPTGTVAEVSAVLTDGAIIDLGGVQLQFQAPRCRNQTSEETGSVRASMAHVDGMDQRPSEANHSTVASKMEKLNVHCPVQLHPLRFDRNVSEEDVGFDQVPHVFPACGHVFGYEERIARSKMCPLCRAPGNFVRLLLKENFQLMSRAECTAVPECVFNPCGHAIGSKLAAHYSSLVMPNGRAICPFCAVHLDARTPFSRLYLYSESDGDAPNVQL